MRELAENLSTNIPFVRVDFYEINRRLYFGEEPLFPNNGYEEFVPDSYDETIGSWLDVELIVKDVWGGKLIRRYVDAVIGLIHLSVEKLWNLNHLHLHGLRYYIGRGVKLTHSGDGLIDLGKKTWVGENCFFAAAHGKIRLGYNNYFNSGIRIVSKDSITIGDNNLFGPNIVIVDHDHKFDDSKKLINQQGFTMSPIEIGSNIWIGANVLICQGVTICDRVVVAGNAVVTKSIIEPGVYGGIPARKIKEI